MGKDWEEIQAREDRKSDVYFAGILDILDRFVDVRKKWFNEQMTTYDVADAIITRMVQDEDDE